MDKDDFTMTFWADRITGEIRDFRVTTGSAQYKLPWYRRLLMRLLGRSHWHKVSFPGRASELRICKVPDGARAQPTQPYD